jgi:putative molybdopterin biosynthesis protein
LLERLLAQEGVEALPETGEPADSHLAVAAAVAAGAADAGLAVRAMGEACDLDFIPITVEPFELAVREDAIDSAAGLLAQLRDPTFTERMAALGGYDLTDTGTQRRAT